MLRWGFFGSTGGFEWRGFDICNCLQYGDDVPFLLPMLDKPRALLPARYMDEIKNLTNDISDRNQAVYEVFAHPTRQRRDGGLTRCFSRRV